MAAVAPQWQQNLRLKVLSEVAPCSSQDASKQEVVRVTSELIEQQKSALSLQKELRKHWKFMNGAISEMLSSSSLDEPTKKNLQQMEGRVTQMDQTLLEDVKDGFLTIETPEERIQQIIATLEHWKAHPAEVYSI